MKPFEFSTCVRALGLATAVALLGSTLASAQSAQEKFGPGYPTRYMGSEAKLATAPNGAVTYDRTLKALPQVVYTEPTVEKIADGLWVIGGYSIVNCIVIEAPEGLIVYDTGDYAEEGALFRKVIEEKISKQPIKAIIYSHSHYALGGGAMVDDPASVMVIGHPKLNETVQNNLAGGGAPSAIPELGPVLTARAAIQFSNFLPDDGEDATLAGRIKTKPFAILPVTHPVEDGEVLDVAGMQLQFFTKYISDDYSTTVYIPEKKAVMNNFFWPGTPNLYSLRGAVYRDPQNWRDGLKVIRDLQPEHLLNDHARAISGKENVSEALTNYMDLITLTYDQTLRGILHGLGPDELRYFIYKPERLANPAYNAETYGETAWFPQAVYYYQLGWFDRDVTKMYQLPPNEEATLLVALMGGRDKVVSTAKDALAKNEYAWAAQLINYVYKLDPQDAEVRQVKADALRKLGQLSLGSIGRAFYLSEARALESKTKIPRLVPPSPSVIAGDPATFVNYYRVRIDPQKAENMDRVLALRFGKKKVGLHIRGGIAEYVADFDKYHRQPDLIFALDGETFAKLYLNTTDLAAAVADGKASIEKGDQKEIAAMLDLFDKFSPAANVTIPPGAAEDGLSQ